MREFEAKPPGSKEKFVFTASPIPVTKSPVRLRIRARYTEGQIVAQVVDRKLGSGDNSIHLADIRSFETDPNIRLVLNSGKELGTAPEGLSSIDADLGAVKTKLDLTKAVSFRVEYVDQPISTVNYEIVVKSKDGIVGELRGKLDLSGGTCRGPGGWEFHCHRMGTR